MVGCDHDWKYLGSPEPSREYWWCKNCGVLRGKFTYNKNNYYVKPRVHSEQKRRVQRLIKRQKLQAQSEEEGNR